MLLTYYSPQVFPIRFSNSLEPIFWSGNPGLTVSEIALCIRIDNQIIWICENISVASIVRHFPLIGKELLIPGPPLTPRSSSLPSAIMGRFSGFPTRMLFSNWWAHQKIHETPLPLLSVSILLGWWLYPLCCVCSMFEYYSLPFCLCFRIVIAFYFRVQERFSARS